MTRVLVVWMEHPDCRLQLWRQSSIRTDRVMQSIWILNVATLSAHRFKSIERCPLSYVSMLSRIVTVGPSPIISAKTSVLCPRPHALFPLTYCSSSQANHRNASLSKSDCNWPSLQRISIEYGGGFTSSTWFLSSVVSSQLLQQFAHMCYV